MCGPTGIGVLYGRAREVLDSMPPLALAEVKMIVERLRFEKEHLQEGRLTGLKLARQYPISSPHAGAIGLGRRD